MASDDLPDDPRTLTEQQWRARLQRARELVQQAARLEGELLREEHVLEVRLEGVRRGEKG